MKIKIALFYAISALSLSLFVIAPSANSSSIEKIIPTFQISSILIESVDHMVSVRY